MKESPRGCRRKRVVAALEAAAAVQQSAPHRRDKKKRRGRSPRQKNRVGRGDREERWRAYFYAMEREICQLLGDEELDRELLERFFFLFSQKIRMGR